jgi:tetratricopeptide (TPR) repeat protein
MRFRIDESRSDSEGCVDQLALADYVAFGRSPSLNLSHQVQRLIRSDCPARPFRPAAANGWAWLGLAAILTGCLGNPQQREARYLASGQKHLQARDFARAVLDFANAAKAVPRDPDAHFQLALAYANYGDVADEVGELQKAITLNPKHVGAQLKLAEILTGNQNPDVVKEGKRKAGLVLALEPANPDALQMLAAAELRLGEPDDAVQHLEQALQKAPQHLKSALTLTMMKLRNNDIAGAEQVLEKAVAEAPHSVEHAAALGRLYLLIGKNAEAENQFQRALGIDPQYGPALTALADLAYRRGRIAEADQLLERASKLPDPAYRPLHAMFLLETGRGAASVAEFERLYKSNSNNRDLRSRLVWAYTRTEQTAAASKLLEDALKKNPKDLDALIQRGELSFAARKYQAAQDDLALVLNFQPDSVEAHLLMARVQQALGAVERQREQLTEVLRLNPGLLAARVELARSFTTSNSPSEALHVLDTAPAQDQGNLALILERNDALYALGDYAEMRKGVDRGLGIARQPGLLLQDGLLRFRLHDLKGGRASLEEALGKQPQNWKALEALAMSYVAEKKLGEATALVRQYTARTQGSAAAQQYLGTWLRRAGDPAGARAAFEAERRLAPNSVTPKIELAELDLRDGKFDAARDWLLPLHRAQPANLTVLLDLAQTEYRASRKAEAIQYYQQAVQQDPRSIPALNNLAFLLADTGTDPDRALELAQQVKELAPNDATINDTIGWAYYQKGVYNTALAYLSSGKSMTPLWKSHLALAYARTGNLPKARELLAELLKEDPSRPEVRRVLDGLAQTR